MPPRTKSHRTLGANSRTHSTTSLHKGHDGPRLAGLTTLAKDERKGPNPRDSLVKAKKHSSSSSALSAKRNSSRTNVRASATRLTSADKITNAPMVEEPKSQPLDDEGWVSSESGVATPVNQEHEKDHDDDDDDDSELDDDEILQLQTQRANRNAREAERFRAAMAAADAELRAREDANRTPPARESPKKHSNMSPARPPSPPVDPRPQPPTPKRQSPAKQPPPASPMAPVVQQSHVEDHTKHTFPTQHTPSPPVHAPIRNGTASSDPVSYDYAQFNGAANGSNVVQTESSRSSARRPTSNARPVSATMAPFRGHQTSGRPTVSRPHPLIRAPSILTKATPALAPLTAPPYLSAHSAQAQISSSPPPKTPSSASTKSSPAHTRQPSISSSIHTLPTLQVSPTATLAASVSSLPHSPQHRSSSLYHYTAALSPTTTTKPIPETTRERTISAVSSTAALHALAHHHHGLKTPSQTRSSVQASTFPPEPADTYGGGMYGGGAGAGVYVGAGASGAYSHATVGGSGGMYGGKPGPMHALLPAPYMATHTSVGRWYAPAREAIGRVVRGKNGA